MNRWMCFSCLLCFLPTGIRTKVVDVTKKEQVEALAKEHDHVDVLFNVAGYFSTPCIILIPLYFVFVMKSHKTIRPAPLHLSQSHNNYRSTSSQLKRVLHQKDEVYLFVSSISCQLLSCPLARFACLPLSFEACLSIFCLTTFPKYPTPPRFNPYLTFRQASLIYIYLIDALHA